MARRAKSSDHLQSGNPAIDCAIEISARRLDDLLHQGFLAS
jgi:hypothetical protein